MKRKSEYGQKIDTIQKHIKEIKNSVENKEQQDFEIANYIVNLLENKETSAVETEIVQKISARDNLQNLIISELGYFYFNFYKPLLKLDIERQHIFRFIYLCTYMNYNNKLEYGNAKGDNGLMVEKDLQEVLCVSRREYFNTKKVLLDNNLIIIDKDNTIIINKKYAIKGDVPKNKIKGSVRIMEKGIQELYAKAKATEHKKLALLIDLLPYINFHHNIICYNPEEENILNIKALNLSNLCDILGYDKSKRTRFKKDLLSIRVNGELTIGFFETDKGKHIYVNPKAYYKGTDYSHLIALVNMFRVK